MNTSLEMEDLIGLFESEPNGEYSDDTPWQYQQVSFLTKRDNETLSVQISESIGEIKILWRNELKILTKISLTDMDSFSVHTQKSDEFLSVNGALGDYAISLKLRLKPCISVEFNQVRDF